jgi:hypothetical protein
MCSLALAGWLDWKNNESKPSRVASHVCSLERFVMKSIVKLSLAYFVLAGMMVVPAVAHASAPPASRTHSPLAHDRTPRVHDHSAHTHHS